MSRDPVVTLHAAADLVPGTRAETALRDEARRLSEGVTWLYPVRRRLLERAEITSLYSDDERTALVLAYDALGAP